MFARIKALGWGFQELLTSGQMTQLDIDHANAMDGAAGGNYPGPLVLTGLLTGSAGATLASLGVGVAPPALPANIGKAAIAGAMTVGGASDLTGALHVASTAQVDSDAHVGGALTIDLGATVGGVVVAESVAVNEALVPDADSVASVPAKGVYLAIILTGNRSFRMDFGIPGQTVHFVSFEAAHTLTIKDQAGVTMQDPSGNSLILKAAAAGFFNSLDIVYSHVAGDKWIYSAGRVN